MQVGKEGSTKKIYMFNVIFDQSCHDFDLFMEKNKNLIRTKEEIMTVAIERSTKEYVPVSEHLLCLRLSISL